MKSRSAIFKHVGPGLVAALSTAVVFGCAGKPSVREQYVTHVKEIREKYDALMVPANAPLAGARVANCTELVEVLTKKYAYWKP
ncbi:MAG: hypothetical protein HY074_07830 [Deltaproteobacteria bacterium]|nr:hypothetical protein [Deltaproteobacteria bacterium]